MNDCSAISQNTEILPYKGLQPTWTRPDPQTPGAPATSTTSSLLVAGWAGSAEIYFRFAVRKFTFRQLRCIFGVEGVGCYLFLAQFCFNINFAMGAVGERHRNLISSWNPIKAPQLLLFYTNLHLKENVILTPKSPVAVGEKLPQSKSEGGRKVGSEILVCCINLHLEAKSPSFCH